MDSKSCQTSKMELFVKIVKKEKPFTIFVKTSILDIWQGSEYASELASKVADVSIWISKVTDNLLRKTKEKEPVELQRTKMFLNRTDL